MSRGFAAALGGLKCQNSNMEQRKPNDSFPTVADVGV